MSYTLSVKQGNLLNEEEATFIVNASNTKLILGSGVSMAFKRHCGNELQQEMSNNLKNIEGILNQGDVVSTSSGKATNFIYALHVAIMDYNSGVKYDKKLPTLHIIQVALQNIENYLKWYWNEKKKTIKLVLPLMGCGVGGLSKVDVINLYSDFFNRNIEAKCDVIIYGYDDSDYELIKSNLMMVAQIKERGLK